MSVVKIVQEVTDRIAARSAGSRREGVGEVTAGQRPAVHALRAGSLDAIEIVTTRTGAAGRNAIGHVLDGFDNGHGKAPWGNGTA